MLLVGVKFLKYFPGSQLLIEYLMMSVTLFIVKIPLFYEITVNSENNGKNS